MRGQRLGRDRSAIGDRELSPGPGLTQPIGSGDNRLRRVGGGRWAELLDRPRRQPEINRLARLPLDLLERPTEEDRQLVGEGRLETDETRLRQADQRLA